MAYETGPEPIKPITPDEALQLKRELLPPKVLETFNRFIGENILSNGTAIVYQDDIVKDLANQGLDRELVFKKGWLDVEDVYREAGWKVEYDKPGYNETYRSSFTFKAPNSRRAE